jgi:hypothetical protein
MEKNPICHWCKETLVKSSSGYTHMTGTKPDHKALPEFGFKEKKKPRRKWETIKCPA